MNKMKMQNISALLVATALSSLVATTSVAQTNTNLFRASINVTCVSTNANGDLVYDRDNTSEFIGDFASGLGITNLSGFSLVLNLSNSTVQVVSGTNQTLVGTALSFTSGLAITNTNHTVVELQSNVRVGTNAVSTGVLSATERFTYGTSNQLTSFSLIGRLSYTEPAVGTNPPAICRGILIAGQVAGEDNDEDENDNGNNGHHGEGNNGNGLGNGGPNGNFNNGNGNPLNNGNNGNNGHGH
jgi:hypothetical protein